MGERDLERDSTPGPCNVCVCVSCGTRSRTSQAASACACMCWCDVSVNGSVTDLRFESNGWPFREQIVVSDTSLNVPVQFATSVHLSSVINHIFQLVISDTIYIRYQFDVSDI